MDEKLTLNNGTEIEGHVLESNDVLFVYLTGGDDIRRCFDLFIEPENTSTIVANRYGEEKTYTGYTFLYSLDRDYGNINLVMRKE